MDNDREELIRRRAYAIWEREGRPEGQDRRHWEQASREMQKEENRSRGGEKQDLETGEKQDLETEGTTHATSTPATPPSQGKYRDAGSTDR
ncbi:MULTISPECIES: DUF2934 domain-containing protein [unclassified Sinorhizobium]|uniref:DUF2934 domain-containing protein n=1 Tax=unclassified Sinorhizobium TaxID=2613772 RepID=UPI0024C42731|nr:MULTISPECIES: DUF2934 domain-containing protein [unclassified Sinorhizobium]MDK1374375.1 DUF2934 domain-containing protein [Sinorhizobium sp. 6-70]MDK1478972.1 DUF2934 domain-containing protein [Sinorhizobium sp. 6-117]